MDTLTSSTPPSRDTEGSGSVRRVLTPRGAGKYYSFLHEVDVAMLRAQSAGSSCLLVLRTLSSVRRLDDSATLRTTGKLRGTCIPPLGEAGGAGQGGTCHLHLRLPPLIANRDGSCARQGAPGRPCCPICYLPPALDDSVWSSRPPPSNVASSYWHCLHTFPHLPTCSWKHSSSSSETTPATSSRPHQPVDRPHQDRAL